MTILPSLRLLTVVRQLRRTRFVSKMQLFTFLPICPALPKVGVVSVVRAGKIASNLSISGVVPFISRKSSLTLLTILSVFTIVSVNGVSPVGTAVAVVPIFSIVACEIFHEPTGPVVAVVLIVGVRPVVSIFRPGPALTPIIATNDIRDTIVILC